MKSLNVCEVNLDSKKSKVNSNYLPTFLEQIQAKTLPVSKGYSGYMSLYDGVPLILDDSIDTYELVIDQGEGDYK
ncbi:hypothetical protein FPZ49_10655 [Paenibacillus cremeus]|uniref:Uncharacterized protein n=1 Tax=Paenibacillus cremeus TaxID=2163881 RepID=A0A559KCG9_9BACL|nr:hypothetical protein FPZ49_10655 [Paenibacillus cremeus]